MMALLAIGVCFAHKTGEWQADIKPIRLCKHSNGLKTEMRPQNSYMRLGLDYIREVIVNPFKTFKHFKPILKLFETTLVLDGGVP